MSTLIHPEWVKMELCDMGKSIFNDLPLSSDKFELKKTSIETSLALQDYELLKNLTKTRQGLLTRELRSKIWPVFMGISDTTGDDIDYTTLPAHKDEDQLKLDIERSFVYYPQHNLSQLRSRLSKLITKILRMNPKLNYYQGYHDVALIFLLIFDDDKLAYTMLEKFTLLHLRDYMLPLIDYSIDHLRIIPKLLIKIDKPFGKLISKIQPFYLLSSIITQYAHNIKSFDDISLMWDFIMCENTLFFAIYFYATTLVYFKKDIFDKLMEISGFEEDEFYHSEVIITENKDFIHSILSNIIDSQMDKSQFFEILQLTLGYLNKFPPKTSKISSNSVLKTSSCFKSNSNLDDLKFKTEYYTKDKILEIFDKQLQECELRQKKTKISFLSKILSNNSNTLVLRNKNLAITTRIFFKISIAVGILSFLIKYYHPDKISNFIIGFQNLQNSILNGNGFTSLGIGRSI